MVSKWQGESERLVRNLFEMARESSSAHGNNGAIIFIDEVDAIGSKRYDSDQSGDREVQRTMLELLNQLDGFEASKNIKVIMATNRIDLVSESISFI